MVCFSGIHDHSVQGSCFLDDLVYCGGNTGFLCDVGLDCEDLAGVSGGESLEVVACFTDVDGVDFCGAVHETAFCDSETDSAVGSGDWVLLELYDLIVSGMRHTGNDF